MPRSAEYRPGDLAKRLADLDALDRANRGHVQPAYEPPDYRRRFTIADGLLIVLSILLAFAVMYALGALLIGEAP